MRSRRLAESLRECPSPLRSRMPRVRWMAKKLQFLFTLIFSHRENRRDRWLGLAHSVITGTAARVGGGACSGATSHLVA